MTIIGQRDGRSKNLVMASDVSADLDLATVYKEKLKECYCRHAAICSVTIVDICTKPDRHEMCVWVFGGHVLPLISLMA